MLQRDFGTIAVFPRFFLKGRGFKLFSMKWNEYFDNDSLSLS